MLLNFIFGKLLNFMWKLFVDIPLKCLFKLADVMGSIFGEIAGFTFSIIAKSMWIVFRWLFVIPAKWAWNSLKKLKGYKSYFKKE